MFKTVALVVGLVVVAIACVSVMRTGGDTSSKERSEKAHALVKEGATLLDVRTPKEYAAGHAGGAINIPINVLETRLSEVPTDRKVVVYCQSGRRSGQAAKILKEAGYDVYDLQKLTDW